LTVRRPAAVLVPAALVLAPAVARASEFAGDAACADCHRLQYASYIGSRHSRAMRPILETSLPVLLIGWPLRERSGIEYEYELADGGLRVSVHKGRALATGVLEWAFGAGAQGITPVGRVGDQYFEHRISFYVRAGRPALTMGHPSTAARSPRDGLGIIHQPAVIYRCFNCHATGVRPGPAGPDLSRMRPGVTCERCHGPGTDHIEAAVRGDAIAGTIRNPGKLAAKAVVRFCGECHSPALQGVPAGESASMARFKAVGLGESRCFSRSQTLSCLTCHDPHRDARRDVDNFYSDKCRGCHRTTHAAGASGCPRATATNCLPCHMKSVELAPFIRTTDHRIRVYRDGDKPHDRAGG
jgi:hypothetical protein